MKRTMFKYMSIGAVNSGFLSIIGKLKKPLNSRKPD